jgi:hypothetical protein
MCHVAWSLARSNNGMHPTRNSAALITKGSGGRVMPGVMRFSLVEMKNLHRILLGFSLLLMVASWATCHYGVAHEISKIPAETRAGMEDFDWIGFEWIWRGTIILFVAIVLNSVALMMWLRERRRIASRTF